MVGVPILDYVGRNILSDQLHYLSPKVICIRQGHDLIFETPFMAFELLILENLLK